MSADPDQQGRRLRVAHVSFGLDVGGLERLLVEFARQSDRARFDLRFVSLGGRGRLAADIEDSGWPVSALDEPQGLRPGLVVRLARLFRRWDLDLVHTHDNRPLVYGGLAARLAGVPRLVHSRHGRSHYSSRRETRLVRHVSRLFDRVVCVSDDASALSAEEGITPRKVRTIRNGIDLDRFSYSGPNGAGPAVIAARLSPEKDVETLIRAVAEATAIAPDFRLEIAGDGPCRPALEELVRDLGLNERVRFLGEVRDVASLLARARVFVLSSTTEGISLTLLEAMARGLPVVATAVGGNPEVVRDGETGLLVPARDPRAMARALVRLWHDLEEGRRLGLAGRRRAEEHFDVRRMVADYEQLYRELGPRAHNQSYESIKV